MKKNTALIGSALALLIAPSVLSNLSPQTVKASVPDRVDLVGTVNGSGVLVDDQGQAITSTFLPNNSSWKLGSTKYINGVLYYQVATNEWIAASSLNVSQTQAQAQTQTSAPFTTSGQIATAKWNSAVINSQGAKTGVTLPAGSTWNTGTTIMINGNSYVQIATDEYVAVGDVSINSATQAANTNDQQVVGTVVNGPADVYDTSMDSFSGRQLQDGSSWKVNQMVQNKYGYTFYQVSNNEWTQSTNMQLNDAGQQKQATSEPEFATSVTQ